MGASYRPDNPFQTDSVRRYRPENPFAPKEEEPGRPSLPGVPAESSSFTGRTREEAEGEPLRWFQGGPTVAGTAKFGAAMLAGGGAGALTARALAGAAGRGLLGKLGVGAASAAAAGIPARAIMADVEPEPKDLSDLIEGPQSPTLGDQITQRTKAAFSPGGLALDVALGASIPLAGEGVRKFAKWWGYTPKTTQAEKAARLVEEVSRRRGGSVGQTALDVRNAAGRPIAVMDLDPQFRQLSIDAARTSPIAERALEAFVKQRAGEPLAGAVDDLAKGFGVKRKDVAVLGQKIKSRLAAVDKERFEALWKAYPEHIKDARVLRQWNAITHEIPASLKGLVSEQVIALKPVKEVVRQFGDTDLTAPTLKGIHRIKVMLDKAVRAGEKAEKLGNLTSDQAIHLGSLRTAREQLKRLTFERVPGGKEYQLILQASAETRRELDALRRGAKAFKPSPDPLKPEGVTPEQMRRDLLELSRQEPIRAPGAKGPSRARRVRVVPPPSGRQGTPGSPDIVDTDFTVEGLGLTGPAQSRLPGAPRSLPGKPKLPGQETRGELPPGGLPPSGDVGSLPPRASRPLRSVRDRRVDLYKTGGLATLAQRAENQSEQSASFLRDLLEKPALREKVVLGAGERADDLLARLRDRLAVSETNIAQRGAATQTRPIDPAIKAGIAGTFGEAGGVGATIGGELGQAKQSLLLALGSKLRQGAYRRLNAAEQKAFEQLVPILTSPVGPNPARELEQIVALLGELNKRRTTLYGAAGALGGALTTTGGRP